MTGGGRISPSATRLLLAGAGLVAVAATAAQQPPTPEPISPGQAAQGPYLGGRMGAFQPFIGAWVPTDPAFRRPDFFGELYEWGPRGGLIRIYEFAHRTNRQRAVFEGIIYWHPVKDHFAFAGYNAAQSFAFEGTYVVEGNSLIREMVVSYPEDFTDTAYPEVAGRQRAYREVRTLTSPDRMQLVIHMRVGSEWRRWPTPDSPPVILERVAVAEPRN